MKPLFLITLGLALLAALLISEGPFFSESDDPLDRSVEATRASDRTGRRASASLTGNRDPTAPVTVARLLEIEKESGMLSYSYLRNAITRLTPAQLLDLLTEFNLTYPEMSHFTTKTALIESLIQRDPYRALIYSYENPDLTGQYNFQMLLPVQVGENDLQRVADFLKNAPTNPYHENYVIQLAERWGGTDPAAALAWAKEFDDPSATIDRIYQSWARKDPKAVARLLPSQPDSPLRQTMVRAVFFGMANQDPNAAISWIDSLPGRERIPTSISAISGLSRMHPSKAAELFDQTISNESLTKEQQKSLTYSPRLIAAEWSETDPKATAQWINELPEGKGRDAATSSLVKNVVKIDPDSAFEWAETIVDPMVRKEATRQVIYDWGLSDPEAAREALDRSKLTDAQRARLHYRIR